MYGNNRICYGVQEYPTPKKPKKLVQQEDGKFVYIDEVNPFADLSGDSFKLKSQLRDGVKLRDCGRRNLEKTEAADKGAALGESVMSEVIQAKAAKSSKSQEQTQE